MRRRNGRCSTASRSSRPGSSRIAASEGRWAQRRTLRECAGLHHVTVASLTGSSETKNEFAADVERDSYVQTTDERGRRPGADTPRLASPRSRSAVGSAATVHAARESQRTAYSCADRTRQTTPCISHAGVRRVCAVPPGARADGDGGRGTGHGAALPAQPANRTSTYHPYNHSNTASRLTLICTGSREDSSAIRWLAAPPPRTITARVRHAYATYVGHVLTTCTAAAAAARDLHAQKVKLPPSFECV